MCVLQVEAEWVGIQGDLSNIDEYLAKGREADIMCMGCMHEERDIPSRSAEYYMHTHKCPSRSPFVSLLSLLVPSSGAAIGYSCDDMPWVGPLKHRPGDR